MFNGKRAQTQFNVWLVGLNIQIIFHKISLYVETHYFVFKFIIRTVL